MRHVGETRKICSDSYRLEFTRQFRQRRVTKVCPLERSSLWQLFRKCQRVALTSINNSQRTRGGAFRGIGPRPVTLAREGFWRRVAGPLRNFSASLRTDLRLERYEWGATLAATFLWAERVRRKGNYSQSNGVPFPLFPKLAPCCISLLLVGGLAARGRNKLFLSTSPSELSPLQYFYDVKEKSSNLPKEI